MAQTINFNCAENFQPIKMVRPDLKNVGIYEQKHLERDGNGVKVVSDGFIDLNKEIQSELKNAGLQNILKLQELRYGTLDAAIVRAKDKGVYADVSNVPTDIASQQELINKTNAQVDKLCKELGITKDQLLNLTPEKYAEIKAAQAAAAAASQSNNEGGNQ